MLLLGGLLFCANMISAQSNFSKIDEQARKVDFPAKQNVAKLAVELTSDLKTETDKARAIFVWITENIRYDAKSLQDKDIEPEQFAAKQQPAQVLRSKKAVCEGYANLFHVLCQSAGLQSVFVSGLSKSRSGRISSDGHAWNVVRAEGKWQLIDATWGAGILDDDMKYEAKFNEKFFFTDPQSFVTQHFPTDPLFQLQETPINFDDFKAKSNDFAVVSRLSIQHFTDTLNQFTLLDSAAARVNSAQRVLRFDPNNGWAHFSLAMTHFEAFNRLSAEFESRQRDIIEKRTKRSMPQLQAENVLLLQIQQVLDDCQKRLNRIPAGDSYWKEAQSLQKVIANNKKSCQDALKSNQTNQERMKARG